MSSSPSITSLKLDPLTGFDHRTPMTMLVSCSSCVESETKYAWYAKGSTTPVSTSHTYEHRSDANNLLKRITIHVTSYNASGEKGKTQTVLSLAQSQLTNVVSISATVSAFTALKQYGTVVALGGLAFAALKVDGTVVAWGDVVSMVIPDLSVGKRILIDSSL